MINFDLTNISNIIQIFVNLMINSNNLNKLEDFGYIDILVKTLNRFLFCSDISQNHLYQKIIMKVLNQINQIIKLSKSRSEIFVQADGIDII